MKKNGVSFRIVVSVLALLMCMSCFTVCSFGAKSAGFYIDSEEVEAGKTVAFTVYVQNNPGMASMAIEFNFDKDVFTPVSVKAGSVLSGVGITSNINSGADLSKLDKLTAFYFGASDVEGNGDFVVFTLKVKPGAKAGTSYVTVSCDDASNQLFEDVAVSSFTAKATIKASDAQEEDSEDDKPASDIKISLAKNAKNIKYMAGYADGTFKPTQAATRYEVVECFDELFEVSGKLDMSLSFKDVDSRHTAMVRRFASAGVLNGYPSDNTFRGTKTITRAEFCKIIAVLLDLDVDRVRDQGFNDVKSHWAANYINACAKEGLVQGKGAARFDPNGLVKRNEVATIINRITGAAGGTSCIYPDVDMNAWYGPAVAAAAK
ncbi:MAG: hypothetical protein E7671_01015 [Ruminococcaceae bacterium]|nr:hypothetical protein [Oscillospiraceae bacterium]